MNFYYHFGKRAKAPLRYNILRHLAEILDGITGLVMIPFGRFGTGYTLKMLGKVLRWQANEYRKNKKLLDSH